MLRWRIFGLLGVCGSLSLTATTAASAGDDDAPPSDTPPSDASDAPPSEANDAEASPNDPLHDAMEEAAGRASNDPDPKPEILLEGPLKAASPVSLSRQESGYGPAEKGHTRIILPSQWVELGGEMAFITSQPALTEEETRFSDLGLLRVRARRSFSDCVEASLHTQLLAKQPSSTDEPLWQGAGLGVRAEVAERFAVALGGSGGVLLNDAGWWWQAAPGVLYKPEISRYLRFLLGAGGSFTMLHFDEAQDEPFWLSEVTADAEIQAGDRNAVMWVGLHYAVPVASNPNDDHPDPVYGVLDPQVRLGLNVGGALTLDSTDWDVYAVFSVIDRGELENPTTTLPILDGGFDQQQIVIGVQHRFGPAASRKQHHGYW